MSRLSAGTGKPLGSKKPPGSSVTAKHIEEQPTRAPVTDVQSSGGDYGTREASSFRKTPAFRAARNAAAQANARQLAARYTHHGPARVMFTASPETGGKYFEGSIRPARPGELQDRILGMHVLDGGWRSPTPTLEGLPLPKLISDAADTVAGGLHSAGEAISNLIKPTDPIGQIYGHSTATDVARNAVQNAFDLPANAVTGIYRPAALAAQGHVGQAGKMLVDPYIQTIKDPIGSFERAPLNTVLMAAGAKAGVGRTIGRVGRAVGADWASTLREPATIPETDLTKRREYSPDVLTKSVQVFLENRKIKKADQLRAQADAIAPENAARANSLEQKAAQVDPRIITPKEIGRRVDENQDANELIRRGHRNAILNQVRGIIQPAVKHSGAALSLITQNITGASKADLLAYRDHLENEFPTLPDKTAQRANQTLRQEIDKVASDPKYHPGQAEVAARQYSEALRPLGKQLVDLGLLDKSQELRSRLIPYAVAHMGAKHDGDALVHEDGSPLSNQDILGHMLENNVLSGPAFITHAPNSRGARNFYRAANREPSVGTHTRTGEAVRGGLFDPHHETLLESAARQQGLIDAAHGWRGFVSEFGVKNGSGDLLTLERRAAQKHARELSAKHGIEYRAIPLKPWDVSKEQLAHSLEEINSLSPSALSDTFAQAAKGVGESEHWGVIPAQAGERLNLHMRAMNPSDAAKAFQAVSQAFKKTVLATSPRWLAGNFGEAGFRAGLEHAGPLSKRTADVVLNRLHEVDPAAYDDLQARALGGGHFDSAHRSIHRGASTFREGGSLSKVANTVGAARELPGLKQLVKGWQGASDSIFQANAAGEHAIQRVMLGKVLRDDFLKGHKLTPEAVDDVVSQLRQVHNRVHAGRRVDDMYGRYGKMSPGERWGTSSYAPFLHWTRNSFKFLGKTLPRDHPFVTSTLAAANESSLDWRRKHHMVVGDKGSVPGWLMGSIPGKGDSHLRISHYLPFGVMDDPVAGIGGLVLPQASDMLAATQGKDFLGNPLHKGQVPPWQTLLDVGKAFAEGEVPAAGQVDRVLSGKGDTATKLRRVFDPFMFTKSTKKTSNKPSPPDWGAGKSSRSTAGQPDWGTGAGSSAPNWP